MTIKEKMEDSKNFVKHAIEEAKKINQEYNYFTTICDDAEQSTEGKKDGRLSGYIVSVKDSIIVKDVESCGGSRVLKGYKPLFDSTAVRRVKKEGGIIIGKTSQDEFGFGSFSTNIGLDLKIPLNPYDKNRACGGSSGGCGGIAKKSSLKHISLAESTGGSIVCPASFCGVVGLCPTYGRISRYGLIDYGNSLDKIGPVAKKVYDCALMLEVISGHDENDSTSSDNQVDKYTGYVNKDVKGMKVGLIKEGFGKGIDREVASRVNEKIAELRNKGVIVEEVSLPLASEYSIAVYYMIATSEASTNLAKYCGMRYGMMEEPSKKSFNEYFTGIRSANFNAESKRRIILGTFARMSGFRDAFYIKAAKVRALIIKEYKELFNKYDALICPTMPVIAPRFDEISNMTPLQNYMMDILLVGPNVAGLPHITVPSGLVKGMPTGTLLIGDHFEEKKIIQLASAIENEE